MNRNNWLYIALFITLIPSCQNLEYSQANTEDSLWELVWQDEFDYVGLPDPEKWDYDVGGHGWGNGESQYYTEADAQNVWVSQGRLKITAKDTGEQLPPDTWAMYKDYTSARLITKGKATWTYGRFEIRAKLPEGRGLWSAIWMLSHDNRYGIWPGSGEIDIMEYVGFNPEYTHSAIHTRAYNHQQNTHKVEEHYVADLTTAFHTYALEWSSEQLLFFVDDTLIMTFENNLSGNSREWPYDHPFYLIMNVAVGGSWGGQEGIDADIFPAAMEIDFVRVFQQRTELQ